MKPLIKIKNLKINVENENEFFLFVPYFEMRKGEKIKIMGGSGSGKSTFFRFLLGFEEAESGKYYYEGKLVDDTYFWHIRKKIAYVDQDLSIPNLRVVEYFEMINEYSNIKKDFKYKIENYLKYFKLDENIIKKSIQDLSGGERQRISLIGAILLGRKVFILDEPTSFLDLELKERVYEFFLNSRFSVIFTAHETYSVNYSVKIYDIEKREFL